MILIPCHRIIGSDRSLVGYRYGLEKKMKLLQLEGSIPKAQEVFTQPLPWID
jgi:methylated-DNA-[protein]-cysteine S-methyltransferase